MLPGPSDAPHSEDEVEINKLVDSLDRISHEEHQTEGLGFCLTAVLRGGEQTGQFRNDFGI